LAAQVKPKAVNKGKAKVIDTGKPEKVKYPIMTGGDFKIREPKVSTPPTLLVAPPSKKDSLREKAEKSLKVARVLQLFDEESPKVGGVVKDPSQPVPQTHVAVEESVKVIEAPPIKKRKLTKVAGTKVPVTGTVTPVNEAVDVARSLASRRKNVALPPVPPLVKVEKFIRNEPVLVVLVAVANAADEEPLRVPEGSIPEPTFGLEYPAYSGGHRHDVGRFSGNSR
jgi:hypothetical protein